MPKPAPAMAAAGLLAAALTLASPTLAGHVESYKEARALAAEKGLPVLIDFYAQW